MNKPDIPADRVPSALLCYSLYSLPSEARDLIQRCGEIRLQGDWQGIDEVALGAERLVLTKVDRCDQAIVSIHLADTCWAADRLELARRSYRSAQETFSLECDTEQRHNEAVAAYGQGLVAYALGNIQEAQRFYNYALRLLAKAQDHWGATSQNARHRQCAEISKHIEQMKKLTRDAPFPPLGTGPRPAPGGVARGVHPVLLGAVPADGRDTVPLDTPLVLLFGKPMQPASFNFDIEPRDRLGQIPQPTWWEENTVAVIRLSHGTFDYAVTYQLDIIEARDRDGNSLVDGPVPRSWSFTTQDAPGARPPVVQFLGSHRTLPSNTPLVVVFSEPMDPATVQPTIDPDPGGVQVSWDLSQTVFAIEHHEFQGTQAKVTIADAVDKQGNGLASPAVQSFNFQTAPPPDAPPQVLDHWPPMNGRDTAVDLPLVVLFDHPVGQPTVRTNPQLAAMRAPSPQPCESVFVLHHSNLLFETSYAVEVEPPDTANPYAWTFQTQSMPLVSAPILGVVPADGATGVPRSVKPLVVFTRQMSTNPADLDWTPKSPSCSSSWSADPLHRVALIHPSKSVVHAGKRDTWKIVSACDIAGNNLIAQGSPHSWTFEIESIPPSPPSILDRKPDRDLLKVAIDAPIEITFSEPMDKNRFKYELSPGPNVAEPEWDQAGKKVTIEHSDFEHSETYRVSIKEAYAQNGLALAAGSMPVTWSFTTGPRPGGPTVRYTYPCDNDGDISLRTPILVVFDQPIETQGFDLQWEQLSPNQQSLGSLVPERWSADRTAVQVQLPDLEPGAEYQVTVQTAENDGGEPLSANRFAAAPRTWRFRTREASLSRGQWVQHLNLTRFTLIAILIALVGSTLLWIWLGWQAAAAFIPVFVLTIVLSYRVWRDRGVMFAVSHDEEALIQVRGRLRVIQGPQPSFWRVPPREQLRAVIPTRPLDYQITLCKITNAHQEQIELVIDIRYRVFNGLKAYRGLLQARDKKDAGSTVFREGDLQKEWQKEICETITLESSNSLHTLRGDQIKKRRGDIEEELMTALLPKTYRLGIELQAFRIADVRVENENT
jgi:hypothetical protein